MDAPDLPRRGGDDNPLVTALQRRLNRLRFDLHDGPQQEVHLLAQDLRLFREQLAPMIERHPDRERALGRLDDLEAQLVALDADLRRLSTAARSPLVEESLADELAQLAEAFHQRTGIAPRTRVSGSIDALTDSQQIAVLSIVRESLSNVRRHSEAASVEIAIAAGEESIVVEVRDDGSGFAPGGRRAGGGAQRASRARRHAGADGDARRAHRDPLGPRRADGRLCLTSPLAGRAGVRLLALRPSR